MGADNDRPEPKREVPAEADFMLCDAIQQILAEYVLEAGEFTISREEAAKVYRDIIKAAI